MINKERILLTGSNGFIGKALCKSLRAAGYEVWGIARSGLLGDKFSVQADLLDFQQTYEAMSQAPSFMALIHTAALAHGQTPPAGESCMSVNLKITDTILRVMEERMHRIILLSSVAVYGEDGRSAPISVNSELRPSTEYGRSKLRCEERILRSGIKNCDILRLAPVYDNDHMIDVRKRVFLPGISFLKLRFTPPPLYSLCHIDTLIQTVLNLLSSVPDGKIISNVADLRPYDQNEVATWFPGKGIAFPKRLVRPIYLMTGLFQNKRAYALRCLYWKLFESNVYAVDNRSLHQ